MYGLYKKPRKHILSTDTQINLFEKLVSPILLYQRKLWDIENFKNVEQFNVWFWKRMLNVK